MEILLILCLFPILKMIAKLSIAVLKGFLYIIVFLIFLSVIVI